MAEKKVIAKSSKALIFVIGILIVVVAVLILSGFKQVNPYLFLTAVGIAIALVIYYLKKPKEQDIFKVVESIKSKSYREWGLPLDFTDVQAIPITAETTNVYLPYAGLTFQVSNNLVKGMQIRHLYKVSREQEKSKLFSESLKYLGAEQKLKQQATMLGTDFEELGLE